MQVKLHYDEHSDESYLSLEEILSGTNVAPEAVCMYSLTKVGDKLVLKLYDNSGTLINPIAPAVLHQKLRKNDSYWIKFKKWLKRRT